MISWFDVIHRSGIERLAEIIRRQLNVWVFLLDSSGIIASLGCSQVVDKPLCDLFRVRGDHLCCSHSYRCWYSELVGLSRECLFLECHAGIQGIIAPVFHKGSLVAAFCASGFLFSEHGVRKENFIRSRGLQLHFKGSEVLHGIQEVVRLERRERLLLADLIQEMARITEDILETKQVDESSSKFQHDYSRIIGDSVVMRTLFRRLDKVVESDSTVLIEGAPGVGKELVARAIHNNSRRGLGPFVVQNCSALHEALLESELFGHKHGAFTGAVSDKAGLFELADGGTLFLDEIGDMSPAVQVKVLRVLQEGSFLPVGDTVERRVNVRILAATNKCLEELVAKGLFRSDLYYRIHVICLRVPSLCERKDDILLLIQHFLSKKAYENKRMIPSLSSEALELLLSYSWPGNVRELENEMERLVVLSEAGRPVQPMDLSERLYVASRRLVGNEAGERQKKDALFTLTDGMHETIMGVEQKMIYHALLRNNWNKTRAAVALGVSRRNLIRKIQRYRLDDLKGSEFLEITEG